MSVRFTPLTQLELEFITRFGAPTWNGPALPRPEGEEGLEMVIDTANRLVARAQYLIQVKDGLSIPYTINGVTATAERFLFGTPAQVQQAADLRGVLLLIEGLFRRFFSAPAHESRITEAVSALELHAEKVIPAPAASMSAAAVAGASSAGTATAPVHADITNEGFFSSDPDYSAFPLDAPEQFSIAWTTFEDAFRKGFPHVPKYAAAITDPVEATRQFWPTLRSTALPYNLFVLQKLTAVTAAPYKTNFGAAWTQAFSDLLDKGLLYGIDMTIFADMEPQSVDNGTTRFTPSTMVLLERNDAKEINPVAVYVANPQNINDAHTYTPASPAWIYALMAAKTSLTVYGIWLGHVYTQHLVTAAMQMATLNTLPAANIIYQLLAPQSKYLISFDLILLLTWSNLSPPTSISSSAKFLTLCNKYAATHDFFATDPLPTLARMNLDVADFTDPSIDDKPWNLYPNVQLILQLWQMTADYVGAVVDAGYADDAAVLHDADLQNWIDAASNENQGNIAGLPRMSSKSDLKAVVTSVLFRITYHGIGRLRSMSSPEPSFATNYPPCLQSTNIPDPNTSLSTAELLKTYLPNCGTLGLLVSFYDIFAYNAPYEPVVPYRGPEDELFFDQAKHPTANAALVQFRTRIEDIIRTLQPDWVQIGQWPRNIEL